MNTDKQLLLHVCCAPCSGGIIETLLNEGSPFNIYFYNPNVHPKDEYERRKAAIKSFAEKKSIIWVDADYDPETWLNRVKGLEQEPERGTRCQVCFDMRLERAALYAHEHGFKILATTNGISRWKDIQQVHKAGLRAITPYPGLTFLNRDWRKCGGMDRMKAVSKREGFYQQTYCGCTFSQNRKTL